MNPLLLANHRVITADEMPELQNILLRAENTLTKTLFLYDPVVDSGFNFLDGYRRPFREPPPFDINRGAEFVERREYRAIYLRIIPSAEVESSGEKHLLSNVLQFRYTEQSSWEHFRNKWAKNGCVFNLYGPK